MANANYYLIDDYTNTGGAGGSGQPVVSQFGAPSLAAATQTAFIVASALQRPLRCVPVGGAPPYTNLVAPQLPTTALTACLSGIGF